MGSGDDAPAMPNPFINIALDIASLNYFRGIFMALPNKITFVY